MEEALLQSRDRVAASSTWELFVGEIKKVSYIAAPMVVVTVSQTLLRIASMMMVGHLGELALSGAAVATSLANVTGFSILVGMASALETLCGQAFGAEQYQKLGTYTYASIICLLVVCLPISLLWIFMDKLLIFIGQDPSISVEAGRYAIWLIPSLFSYAILQSLIRYLQTQSLILPMLWSSVAALIFHIPLCWALVYKVELGIAGAALSIGLSYWFNVILLLFYVKYSSTCKKTHATFSKSILPSMKEFSCFAVPSTVMICLEWWSFEIVVLLAGLLPNPQLETSVLSICLMVALVHYFIPYSIGAAASTIVSNELGAGCPERAQASVWAANFLSIAEAIAACTVLFCCRHFLGYAFSNDKEVVDYLGEITPFVCLLLAMDSIQAVLSGVARGGGWQHLGAYVNLGSYYLVGLPTAAVLGFVLHVRGKGLWLGLNTGSIVQTVLLLLVTCSKNWRKQASMARQRLFEGSMVADDGKKFDIKTQGRTFLEHAGQDPSLNHFYNAAMASDARLVSSLITRDCRHVFQGLRSIVDVGGGTGTMANAFADEFPGLKCSVLDLPHVVAGLQGTENLTFVGGDMFDSVPPADAVFMKWMLHVWPDAECVKILEKCKQAIPSKDKGGKVVIVDIVFDNQKDHQAVETQLFYDMMLMTLAGGRERAEKEWANLFYAAGFTSYKISPVLGLRSLIEVFP